MITDAPSIIRPLTSIALACALVWGGFCLTPTAADAQEPQQPNDAKTRQFLLGQEPVEPFVPLEPRTAEAIRKLEAIKQFCIGVKSENDRRWNDAINAYAKALENDPKSVAIYKAIINACFVARRTQEASQYLRQAVELAPDDYELLRRLGEAIEEQGQVEQAVDLYRRALASPKLNQRSAIAVLIKFRLGLMHEVYEQLKNPEEAAKYYQDVMEALDRPAEYQLASLQLPFLKNRVETYERFGNAFRLAKRYDEALRAYRQAQAFSPRNSRFTLNIAQVYIDQEKYLQALENLEKYLREQPVQGSQPYELLSLVLERLNRSEEILPRVEAASEKDQFNMGLRYFLGTLYEKAGQVEKAKEIYLAVLKSPSDARVYKSLARIYQKEDRFRDLILLLGNGLERQLQSGAAEIVDEQLNVLASDADTANRVIQTARQIHQEDGKLLNLGARYFVAKVAQQAKLHQDAADFLQLCVEARPEVPLLHRELATELQIVGKTDEAIQSALEAVRLDPQDVQNHHRLGLIYAQAGMHDKAAEKYEQILKDFGENPAVAYVARLLLSNVYVQSGELAKAEKALEEILAQNPEDPTANNDLGYLWADQGKNLDKSLEMIKKALDAEPENAAYLDSMGWVLYKLGRAAEARKYLEDAVKRDEEGDDATIIDHLGDVYARLKEFDKAREMWQKAAEVLEKAEGSRRDDKRLAEIRDKLKSAETQKRKGEIKRDSKDNP